MPQPVDDSQESDCEEDEIPEPEDEEDLVVQNVQRKNAEGVEPLEGSGWSVNLNVALRHLGKEDILKMKNKIELNNNCLWREAMVSV